MALVKASLDEASQRWSRQEASRQTGTWGIARRGHLHSLVELLLGDGLVAKSLELVGGRHVWGFVVWPEWSANYEVKAVSISQGMWKEGRGIQNVCIRGGGKADRRAKNIYWQAWARRLLVGLLGELRYSRAFHDRCRGPGGGRLAGFCRGARLQMGSPLRQSKKEAEKQPARSFFIQSNP